MSNKSTQQLQVLMMGGQRSGKTSLIAGLLETIEHGEVSQIIKAVDETKNDVTKQMMREKVQDLKYYLRKDLYKTFLVDDEKKTSTFEDIYISFGVPKTDKKMTIKFTDANGEFYDTRATQQSGEIRNLVEAYDVFVIAIDTTYLMEAVNPDNKMCTEAVNKKYNCVGSVQNFLTYVDDKEGNDAKLVIFVPLKCEKWAKEGKLDDVVHRVEEVYATAITNLSSYSNVEIDIMPVQTVGNIVFVEQLAAYVYQVTDEQVRKCALDSSRTMIRFGDGEERERRPTDKIFPDGNAAMGKLVRPNSWYKIVGSSYEPSNCDQLAYYILRFFLAKAISAKGIHGTKKNKKSSFWENIWLAPNLSPFIAVAYATYLIIKLQLGTLSLGQLEEIITKLQKNGLIKVNCEGIKTIKESRLYKMIQ